MVTMENYEEYMILQADGELDEAGIVALQAFLSQHPELADEMSLFDSLRLEPDTTMVYAHKEALLQPVPVKRTIALGWRSYAAAAGVAAVIGIAAWMYQRTDNGDITGRVATLASHQHMAVPAVKQPVIPIAAGTPLQPAPPPAVNNYAAAVKKAPVNPAPSLHTDMQPPKHEELAALEPVQAQQLQDAPKPIATAVTATAPDMQVAMVAEEKQNKRFLNWLPINDEKKQGLIMVKKAIDERVEQVRELNNNIKETALVLNIGPKGFTLNF